MLALIGAIRTFQSFSLEVDLPPVDGRWQGDRRALVPDARLVGANDRGGKCTLCAHYRGAACPHERPASWSP